MIERWVMSALFWRRSEASVPVKHSCCSSPESCSHHVSTLSLCLFGLVLHLLSLLNATLSFFTELNLKLFERCLVQLYNVKYFTCRKQNFLNLQSSSRQKSEASLFHLKDIKTVYFLFWFWREHADVVAVWTDWSDCATVNRTAREEADLNCVWRVSASECNTNVIGNVRRRHFSPASFCVFKLKTSLSAQWCCAFTPTHQTWRSRTHSCILIKYSRWLCKPGDQGQGPWRPPTRVNRW